MLAKFFVPALLSAMAVAAPTSVEERDIQARSLDINAFLAKIISIFPVNVAVNDICGALGEGEKLLADAFDLSINQNRQGCSDVSLIFARGTCDPGNVGALVGPPVFQAVQAALGSKSLSVQGVPYPASVEGYLNADSAAGQTMANLVKSTLAACPKTKIVLSGYSQGGYAVHNAANDLGSDMSKVSAVVVFGDPMSHTAVSNIDQNKVKIICHDGDDICNQGFLILPQHITYAIDAGTAASFIASHV